MTQDPRMELELPNKVVAAPHKYVVTVRGRDVTDTNDRHRALQLYVALRKANDDFSDKPEEYIVRLFCDGVEYLNDQESWPPGWRDRGKSCRQLTGAVRPYPWERKIP